MTLDIVMPVMSGLAATEYIMAYVPTPILIVSASTNRGELFKTYDALAAGALDVLEKPTADDVDYAWEARFRAAVKLIARIKVITHPRARLGRTPPAAAAVVVPESPPAPNHRYREAPSRVVAIGASTGGPAAVGTVLRGLSRFLPVSVVRVAHG